MFTAAGVRETQRVFLGSTLVASLFLCSRALAVERASTYTCSILRIESAWEKKSAHLRRTKSFASRRSGSKRRRRPSESRSDGVTLSTSINALLAL